ncbi:MAG: LCP family protein [Clostridia bacterium]|nr:LCP family protein [Clostridia bacterium]
MNNNKGQKQVSLAGVAKTQKKKKARVWPWKWIGIALGMIALLAAGVLLFNAFDEEEKPSLSAREMVEYTYTSDALAKDVSYYLLGVTGAEIGDPMDMLAVMCYDRKAQSVSVVQIPVATYIDKNNGFAVDTFGDVWSNPVPEQFCSTCRVRVTAEDLDGKVHGACGSEVEERTGSAVGNLIRVINEQYGLPIDNYLILPRSGLSGLIEALDGIEVELSKKVTLAGETYSSGVQTLTGPAAAEYAITYNYKNTPASDRDRMLRQRQVLAGLWQKIAACDKKDLYYIDDLGATKGVLGRLMTGKNPVRFNTTSFGKARLLGMDDAETEDIKLSDALARFAMQLGDIPMEKITFSILPGSAQKVGTATVYSVHRDQTIALLNDQLNPYGLVLDEDTVTVPQVKENVKDVDLSTATLDTVVPKAETEKGEE